MSFYTIGIFEGSEYWDVHVTVAKHTPCDILFSYAIHNRSPHKATICVLPSVWFRCMLYEFLIIVLVFNTKIFECFLDFS